MLPVTSFNGPVELRPGLVLRSAVSHVLFDFDGTLSLIREGWANVMVPMFVEMLPRSEDESDEQIRSAMFDDVMRLNGKQTIFQMIQFVQRINERGGKARDPVWYKNEFLLRLKSHVGHRLDGLRNRTLLPDSLLVFGARAALEYLQARGLSLYLASGTDDADVKHEAGLLEIDQFFGMHIYGAREDYQTFSKKMLIERILRENEIPGGQLLAFGDGYVEIQNTKEVGGLAVAVASDEANNGSGRIDAWKRHRLLDVGADIVIPDYRDAIPLLDHILGEPA